jgi:hypothetical protein
MSKATRCSGLMTRTYPERQDSRVVVCASPIRPSRAMELRRTGTDSTANCGRRNPADGSKTPFAPRFGFAWRPFGGDKTVVRGGYGIFWDSFLSREIDDSGDLYPYVERTQLSPNSQDPSVAPKLTDQLFPSQTAIVPITAPNSQFVAVIISDHPRNPYVQQYTLSVQRQIARNTTLEVNYVGNRGLHLLDRIDLNTPSQLTGNQLSTCQAAFAGLPATQGTYFGNQCPFFLRQPLPNFAIPGPLNSSWTGYSNYNAGNVKLEHRSSDLALLTVYTWAKSMDDKSAPAGIGSAGAGFAGHMDDRIPSLDYGPSDFSVKHRFVNSVVYALPIGRGKRVLGNANRLVNLAVGGWQLTAITTFQTGFPFSITAPDPAPTSASACGRTRLEIPTSATRVSMRGSIPLRLLNPLLVSTGARVAIL